MEIDAPRFAALGFDFTVNGSTAIFRKGDVTARVLVKDGKLEFAPASSAAQRHVLAALSATPV